MSLNLARHIEKKIDRRQRLDSSEGLFLLRDAPLAWLGRVASEVRVRKVPSKEVTYVIDSNPNTTNICDTNCQFCAFYRRPTDRDAYALSVEEVMRKIDRASKMGVTTVLLQGGHNRDIPFEYYTTLLQKTRKMFPHITPHFFSASEIKMMSEISGKTISRVLGELKNAGQHTLPGGGAEILSERVRQRVSPKKGGPAAWLDVHREAHQQGYMSTATMMYGHLEEPEDILEHWDHIRSLQDDSLRNQRGGCFTAFIPWSFKSENTVLQRRFPRRTGPVPYLRMIAASRIYLDNFDHIQASWFSEGKKTGQAALHFGADDFGGTLYEENVHAEAGFVNTTTHQELIALIHEVGFDAVQRTTRYERLAVYPRGKFKSSLQRPVSREPEISLRKNSPVISSAT